MKTGIPNLPQTESEIPIPEDPEDPEEPAEEPAEEPSEDTATE